MNMFDIGNVALDSDQDVLGGGGIQESGIYDCTIKLAYITRSDNEAMAVNLVLETDKKVTIRQQIYISSGKAKNHSFTYVDKEGNSRPLPGYSQINSLCELAIGKSLKEIEPEDKVIALYDFKVKKEVPTKVPVLTDLTSASITVGLLKILSNKQVKNAVGEYVATAETRESNEINKLFKTEGRLSSSEIAAGLTQGEFAVKWAEKFAGKTQDKTTVKSGTTTTAPVTPPSTEINQTKKLFG